MAGFYPDYPETRIAWHLDGTVCVRLNGDVPPTAVELNLSAGHMATLNNETTDTVSAGVVWFAWIFPQFMDLSALYARTNSNGSVTNVEWSANTTNGVDGSWTQETANLDDGTTDWRQTIRALPLTGVKGIRLRTTGASGDLSNVHIFGAPTTLTNLQMWHPTLDERVGGAHFDWGDTPRNGSADVTFRVKNCHDTETAEGVAVSLVDSTDSSPSFTDAHYLSDDGSTFTASLNLGDLAPGEISDVLTLRRALLANQPLGPWAMIPKAAAASWA